MQLINLACVYNSTDMLKMSFVLIIAFACLLRLSTRDNIVLSPLALLLLTLVWDGRTSARGQQNRANLFDSFYLSKQRKVAEDCPVAIPFLDHPTLTASSHHFRPLPHLCLFWCLHAIASFVQQEILEIDNATQAYHDDLPSPELVTLNKLP